MYWYRVVQTYFMSAMSNTSQERAQGKKFNDLAVRTTTMKAETKPSVQAPKAVVHHTKSWFKTVLSCSPLAF